MGFRIGMILTFKGTTLIAVSRPCGNKCKSRSVKRPLLWFTCKKVVAWTRVNLKKGSEQRLWVYFEDNINRIC